ncbi:MAG: phosphate acyltransferase PlsX [Ruminiclostridium sp.]|nr:phosphate acyltransferase PlsX [Ruminiclostridium sp.]
MIKIAVDLKGADRPQTELVSGALAAVRETDDLFVYLCGDKSALEPYIEGTERIELIDAPEVITNNEDPAEAFKNKKNSSLVRGMELCKNDPDVGALVSCGATGAIFVSAMMMLGRIGRISPMLLVELRHADGSPLCIVDCGANVDCRPEKLVDFARMGIAYMKAVGVAEPKVGLLSNGAEDKKGNAVVKAANELLRAEISAFVGNIEGTSVLTGNADIIVCDGFSGNILLKTVEGSAKAVLSQLRAMPGVESAVGDRINELYTLYDFNSQGGAVLLGTRLPVIKGHGAANAETVRNIVLSAYRLAKNGLNAKIEDEFAAKV